MFIVFMFENQKIRLYHRLIFYFLLLLSIFGVLEKLFPNLSIFTLLIGGGDSARISSLMQNPNPFGVLMAFGAVLSIILFKKKMLSLKELYTGIFLFTITAIFSGSRNAILTLVVGLILLLVYGEIRWKNFLIYGSISVLLLLPIYFSGGLSRLLNFSPGDGLFTERLQLWKKAVEIFSSHPVTGVGVGVFRARIADKMFSGLAYTTHNVVLDIADELGFVGLALSGAFIVAIFRKIDFKEPLAVIPVVMFFMASLFDFFDSEVTFVVISLCFLAFAANSGHEQN